MHRRTARILSRYVFREIVSSALIGVVLFTFVLFLRSVGQLFELLVRRTASAEMVAYLFVLTLPQTLTFTIPMGVLVALYSFAFPVKKKENASA